MKDCNCDACEMGCEPHECRRLASHPQRWRDQLRELVTLWAEAHRASVALDPGDLALDLGLVDVDFTGADLHAIAGELVLLERERELAAAVVTYSRDGQHMGARCPRCLAPADRHRCGAELRSAPISLELALRISTGEGANDSEAA